MKTIAAVLTAMVFLAGLARLSFNEPVLPDADDCAARGRPADCWKAYEFVAPDERSEPRPLNGDDCTARGRDEECWRER